MDSADEVSTQISGYITDGRPSKALKVVARYSNNPDCTNSLVFCLNAVLAAVRSKQPHGVRRRLLVRYLKLLVRCPQYHKDIEGNFWHMQASVATDLNPVAALMMYQWVLELDPGRRQTEIVDSYIRKIKEKYPDVVVRDTLTRKELVEKRPRHFR